MDPRQWDLSQLLAAYEATLRQHAKDDAAWDRTQATLTAEPKAVKAQRLADTRAAVAAGTAAPEAPNRMSLDDAEAMLARFAASEAQYG